MTREQLIFQVMQSIMPGFITTKELADRLGLRDERELRAKGSDPGILEKAKAYAYREHRMLLVTNYKGIKMFDNPKDALNWTAKKQQRLVSESRSIRKEVLRANHAMNSLTQMKMELY